MGVDTGLRMKGNKYGKGFTGRHSLETRQKLSEINKANPVSYWKGKKRSPETIQKMRDFARTRVGSSAPRWKSDRTSLAKSIRQSGHAYRVWKEAVFKKYEYKCMAKKKDCVGKLEAHHILPWRFFPTLRYDVGNGIPLCHKHHPRSEKNEELFAINFVKSEVFTG